MFLSLHFGVRDTPHHLLDRHDKAKNKVASSSAQLDNKTSSNYTIWRAILRLLIFEARWPTLLAGNHSVWCKKREWEREVDPIIPMGGNSIRFEQKFKWSAFYFPGWTLGLGGIVTCLVVCDFWVLSTMISTPFSRKLIPVCLDCRLQTIPKSLSSCN